MVFALLGLGIFSNAQLPVELTKGLIAGTWKNDTLTFIDTLSQTNYQEGRHPFDYFIATVELKFDSSRKFIHSITCTDIKKKKSYHFQFEGTMLAFASIFDEPWETDSKFWCKGGRLVRYHHNKLSFSYDYALLMAAERRDQVLQDLGNGRWEL